MRITLRSGALLMGLLLVTSVVALAAPANVRDEPAKIDFKVLTGTVDAGGQATLRLQLRPAEGVKINRYPQIKLSLPGHAGLYDSTSATLGNPTPPPADRMDSNYFDKIDAIELEVPIAVDAHSGHHQIEAQLVYFYCVTDSGYCAPARIPLSLSLDVR
ncbi:MAG: hypothetical protein OES25_10145 [Acidobacteriota bacterium]|nr:hypothetical protein [Acidobacteriota bacterium]